MPHGTAIRASRYCPLGRERVPAAAAAGRVAAETISPYPPGIPAIAPGELLTTELLDVLRDETHAGSRMAGASDPTLETLLVVRS